jgi:hypothetical protein
MSFNLDAFVIAGTAIAIAGFGLYLWDTRAPSFSKTSTASSSDSQFGIPGVSPAPQSGFNSSFSGPTGGRKKTKSKAKSKNVKKSLKK